MKIRWSLPLCCWRGPDVGNHAAPEIFLEAATLGTSGDSYSIAYAHRQVVVKDIMSFIDANVFKQITHWLCKEHRNNNWSWISKTYRRRMKGRFCWGKSYTRKDGRKKWIELFRMADVPVRYHSKIRGNANPYDRQYHDYFALRKETQRRKAMKDRLFLSSDSYGKLTRWK